MKIVKNEQRQKLNVIDLLANLDGKLTTSHPQGCMYYTLCTCGGAIVDLAYVSKGIENT